MFEVRYAEDVPERHEILAAELVGLKPAVILTATSAGVAACMKASAAVPIVFATAGNPDEQGFVASLSRPGGNVTGVMVHLIDAKLVEMVRLAFPQAKRLAMLAYDRDPVQKRIHDDFESSAKSLKFDPVVVSVRRVEELSAAFNEVVAKRPAALVLPNISFAFSNSRYLIERAIEARLALVTGREETTDAGALLSYGTDRRENYRRAATMVDKILRGAKPSDLPVERPERFQLVVNMKTAKAIGVTLSPTIMLRADRVVE